MPAHRKSMRERVVDRIHVDGTGCWLWTGERNNAGYGVVDARNRVDGTGRPLRAHRVVYEMLIGPIPAGLVIDHLCRVPLCVNPAHLEPVTDRINALRGIGIAAVNAAKTHCIHGHEFTPENTRFRSNGSRNCRACDRFSDLCRPGRRQAS